MRNKIKRKVLKNLVVAKRRKQSIKVQGRKPVVRHHEEFDTRNIKSSDSKTV